MDFVEGLLKSNCNSVEMVVADRLSKNAYFIATMHPFTSSKIAELFRSCISNLYGIPSSIVSDRYLTFTRMFSEDNVFD